MTDLAPTTVPGLEFVQTVLSQLVDDPQSMVVLGRVDEMGVLITVRVSDRDMGKLIGKGGLTIKSLRTLLRVLGGSLNQRINLKVLEPEAPVDAPLS